MRVIVREAAYADLEQITAGSRKTVRATPEVHLAFFPHSGHVGRAPGTREWVVRGLPYIVVYRVDDVLDELTVLAIFQGAQDR